jgi:sulfur carrier protein
MQSISKKENILVKVNGEDKLVPQNISILSLLELFKINKDRVVIELNKIILKKSDFEATILSGNEEIEIVTFVGGG